MIDSNQPNQSLLKTSSPKKNRGGNRDENSGENRGEGSGRGEASDIPLAEKIADTLAQARHIQNAIQDLEKKIGAKPQAIPAFLHLASIDPTKMKQAHGQLLNLDRSIGTSFAPSQAVTGQASTSQAVTGQAIRPLDISQEDRAASADTAKSKPQKRRRSRLAI